MHIKMKRDRIYTPKDRRTSVKFKAEKTYPGVKREWGEAMVTDGDAEKVPTPRRTKADA